MLSTYAFCLYYIRVLLSMVWRLQDETFRVMIWSAPLTIKWQLNSHIEVVLVDARVFTNNRAKQRHPFHIYLGGIVLEYLFESFFLNLFHKVETIRPTLKADAETFSNDKIQNEKTNCKRVQWAIIIWYMPCTTMDPVNKRANDRSSEQKIVSAERFAKQHTNKRFTQNDVFMFPFCGGYLWRQFFAAVLW